MSDRIVRVTTNEGSWSGTYDVAWPEGAETVLDALISLGGTYFETVDGFALCGRFVVRAWEPGDAPRPGPLA